MASKNSQGFYQLAIDFKGLSTSGLDKNIQQGLTIAGIQIQQAARQLVPIDTGDLRKSISSKVSSITGGIRATIQPTEPYAGGVELGQPAGTYVSPVQLMAWARRKGLNPYAISRSILNKGTQAQPYLFPAFDQNVDSVILIIGQALQNALNQAMA